MSRHKKTGPRQTHPRQSYAVIGAAGAGRGTTTALAPTPRTPSSLRQTSAHSCAALGGEGRPGSSRTSPQRESHIRHFVVGAMALGGALVLAAQSGWLYYP